MPRVGTVMKVGGRDTGRHASWTYSLPGVLDDVHRDVGQKPSRQLALSSGMRFGSCSWEEHWQSSLRNQFQLGT